MSDLEVTAFDHVISSCYSLDPLLAFNPIPTVISLESRAQCRPNRLSPNSFVRGLLLLILLYSTLTENRSNTVDKRTIGTEIWMYVYRGFGALLRYIDVYIIGTKLSTYLEKEGGYVIAL